MMHVKNRINQAHVLAQEWLRELGVKITEETQDTIALHILIAELINAIQGLDYKGEKL